MKKQILLAGLLLVSANTFAGTCTNATVKGIYTYNISATGFSPDGFGSSLAYIVGRMSFDGAGKVTVGGIESDFGVNKSFSAAGTYTVNTNCILTSTYNVSVGNVPKTQSMSVYLDTLDTTPTINVAYHGNALVKTSGRSGSGAIDRVVGKF